MVEKHGKDFCFYLSQNNFWTNSTLYEYEEIRQSESTINTHRNTNRLLEDLGPVLQNYLKICQKTDLKGPITHKVAQTHESRTNFESYAIHQRFAHFIIFLTWNLRSCPSDRRCARFQVLNTSKLGFAHRFTQ
jgi:hypothetical protein